MTSISCPRCRSNNIFAHKKGYSVGKGCLGFNHYAAVCYNIFFGWFINGRNRCE